MIYIAIGWVILTILNVGMIGLLEHFDKLKGPVTYLIEISLILILGSVGLFNLIAIKAIANGLVLIGSLLLFASILICLFTFLTHRRWHEKAMFETQVSSLTKFYE